MIKMLVPERGQITDLLAKIRDTRNRRWRVSRARLSPVEGRKTVLALASGRRSLGEVRARTSSEAKRLAKTDEVVLTIGWDESRNEVLQAEFD